MVAAVLTQVRSSSPSWKKIFPSREKLDFQIDNEQSLAHLIEIRNVTVICVSTIPYDCTVFELISLTDEIFKIIQKYVPSLEYMYIYIYVYR